MMDPPLSLLKQVQSHFTQSNQNLSVVESCTGGLLSFWLTSLPGASQYFKGALVAYKTEVKTQLLGISPEKIKKEGLCTGDLAQSMAQGVKSLLKTDWAVAITGIAGPDTGEKGEPIGKVAFSVSSHRSQKSLVKQFQAQNGQKRKDIQRQSALFALNFLISEFK